MVQANSPANRAGSRRTPSAAGPRRSARREATRSRLLTSATEVLAERGFHGASVENICERAGFTRGAFYSNFTDLDELVLELLDRYADHVAARAEALAGRADLTPEEVLEGVFAVWSEEPRAETQWHLLQAEFTLHAIRDPRARKAWTRQQNRHRATLAGLVERVAAAHGLTLSVTPDEFVRLAHAVYQGGMAQHLLHPRTVGRRDVARAFVPLVLGGAGDTG